MLNEEEIAHQQDLLAEYRRTLAHLCKQAALYGGEVYAPLMIANGIREARGYIRRIKELFRGLDVIVADLPDDEPPASDTAVLQPQRPPITPLYNVMLVHRGDTFSEGLAALHDLIAQIPDVRDAAVAFRTVFQAACEQIDVLDSYKELHDQLHELQFLCYDCVDQEARRFPEDDIACDNLRGYALNFEDIASNLQEAAEKAPFADSKIAWIQELVQAREQFLSAIENEDIRQLKRATWIVKRILDRQPSQINTHLNDTARALRLPALVKAMQHVHDTLLRLGMETEQVRLFEAGVAALKSLNHELTRMVEDHDRWQAVDCVLRRIEDRLEQDIDEFLWSWPDLRAKAEPLYATSAEKWAVSLKVDAEKLAGAFAAEDPVKIKQFFRRYRSQAGKRFYRVDKKLKELCDELRQVDGPLASVLRLLE